MPKKSLFPLLFIFFLTIWPSEAPAQQDDFKVIVHAGVKSTSESAKQLSKVFLKKVKRWDDGQPIEVFDLDGESPVRESFTRTVHEKSISAIKSYWQRMIFSGRDVAPDELSGDDLMIEKVAQTPGAIGYVSASKSLPKSVKVIEVTNK